MRLLNVSENATFRVDLPSAAPVILRVHRPGYHSEAEIASELLWIEALRADDVVRTPAIVPTVGRGADRAVRPPRGRAMRWLSPSRRGGAEARRRPGAWVSHPWRGQRPVARPGAGLGRPAAFQRKHWTYQTIAGQAPHWGPWQAARGLTPSGRAVLARLAATLEARLEAWGAGPERYGLIHADLRLANLLMQGEALTVIDFDDCGFGWFLFDFAAAVSFIEDDPALPELMDAWVRGYRSVAPLTEEEVAMLPSFVLLRRLQLTAWIASHPEAPTAQEMGAAFTDTTVALADSFLRSGA